ncbi:MAG: TM2 domain-containing protein [Thioalkalivibrionaceae bacterium]
MNRAWKTIDLEGGGLQSMNARYASLARRRPLAFLAWIGFALGLHRFYLREPLGGALQIALTLTTAGIAGLGTQIGIDPVSAAIPAVGLLGWAVFDLFWIERRLVDINKTLRIQLFLRRDAPNPGAAGVVPAQRYADDDARRIHNSRAPTSSNVDLLAEYRRVKERERGGHVSADDDVALRAPQPKRVLSFNEQEALLRAQRSPQSQKHSPSRSPASATSDAMPQRGKARPPEKSEK